MCNEELGCAGDFLGFLAFNLLELEGHGLMVHKNKILKVYWELYLTQPGAESLFWRY